jgi:hypothetical protein
MGTPPKAFRERMCAWSARISHKLFSECHASSHRFLLVSIAAFFFSPNRAPRLPKSAARESAEAWVADHPLVTE